MRAAVVLFAPLFVVVTGCFPAAPTCVDDGCPGACVDGRCLFADDGSHKDPSGERPMALTGVGVAETRIAFTSCAAIHEHDPRAPSATYVIAVGDALAEVECDMERGGFTVVAHVQWDPADASSCPADWLWTNQGCAHSTFAADVAASAVFPVPIASYHEVRGEARAFSGGSNDGFAQGVERALGVDDPYADGVSITLAAPRVHVWTFAAALPDDDLISADSHRCPCAGGARNDDVVGDFFSCESPATGLRDNVNELWDGAEAALGCDGSPDARAEFVRDVGEHTEPLEARIMGVHGNLDVEIENVYVTRLTLEVR